MIRNGGKQLGKKKVALFGLISCLLLFPGCQGMGYGGNLNDQNGGLNTQSPYPFNQGTLNTANSLFGNNGVGGSAKLSPGEKQGIQNAVNSLSQVNPSPGSPGMNQQSLAALQNLMQQALNGQTSLPQAWLQKLSMLPQLAQQCAQIMNNFAPVPGETYVGIAVAQFPSPNGDGSTIQSTINIQGSPPNNLTYSATWPKVMSGRLGVNANGEAYFGGSAGAGTWQGYLTDQGDQVNGQVQVTNSAANYNATKNIHMQQYQNPYPEMWLEGVREVSQCMNQVAFWASPLSDFAARDMESDTFNFVGGPLLGL